MSDLPENWVVTTLEDVADWGSGGTPSRNHREYYGGEIPWIKTGELGQGIITETEEKITELGLQNSSAKVFPKDSVAVAMYGATIGKVAILGIDAATNQACAVAQPISELTTTKYLAYFLMSERDNFVEAGKGGAQPNISQRVIKEWRFPLAPLNEQKRIADKLETLLTQVTSSLEKLNRVFELVKQFRQAVLGAATAGVLTEDWRKKKDRVFDWKTSLVRKVGKVQLGRQRSPKYHSGENMRPYLSVQNVFEARIDVNDVMEMNFSPKDFEIYKLHHGDILLNEGQSPELLGRPAIFNGEIPNACFTNTLIRFQANTEILKPEFALIVFRHYLHAGRFNQEGTITTNLAHLGAGRFAEIEFPLPSITEQLEIASRVEALFTLADQLETRINIARDQLEKLTPALLAKAFRGELVPQDPADEPASILLERIRAARELQPVTKPERKPRTPRTKPLKAGGEPVKRLEDVPSDHLTQTIKERDPDANALEAKTLWQASDLSIDDFYLQLSREVSDGLLRVNGDQPAIIEAA